MLRVMDLKRWLVLWSGLLVLVLAWPAQAHNGAVAIAVPVEGIKIDGDLSDWPQDMRRYPIALPEKGVRPADEQDFKGSFQVGYNAQENALYVAVEVQDESTVIDTTAASSWDTQDGCEVYLVVGHKEGEVEPAQWVIWGNARRSFGAAVAAGASVAARRGATAHLYEWRLDLRQARQEEVPIQAATVIGFDVVVADKDADGSFSWMAWGSGTLKERLSDRLGDVVVVGEKGMGKIQGKVRWEDREEGVRLGRVQVQSLSGDSLWVSLQTDSTGGYEGEVPAGTYRVEVGYRRKAEQIAVEVRKGETAQVREVFFARPPVGVEVKAGKGKVTKAGAGFRQGPWYSLDVADGLPGAFIRAVLQDREGYLWFGTNGGVSRYDGQQFKTFTAQDGLAGNEVNAIFQDQEGHLWFGTDGGVSRYDGQQFKTFTTRDSLAGNVIGSIFQDREGQLWFGASGGVSRYDGQQQFRTLTTKESLGNNGVLSILQDREGRLWFGTDGGVSRYDGQRFKTFTAQEGLAGNRVWSIVQDREGHLWFGTDGGVSRYDGQCFQTFGKGRAWPAVGCGQWRRTGKEPCGLALPWA